VTERDQQILLAFDFGLRRLGIATANLQTRTASPLKTLIVDVALPWNELDRVVDDWQPSQLVVGMPCQETARHVAERAHSFARALNERYRLPVATVDETLTSRAARAELAAGRRSGFLRRRIGKGKADRLAACLIAEQWMSTLQ
jgi:putative Holliday junction resolvase